MDSGSNLSGESRRHSEVKLEAINQELKTEEKENSTTIKQQIKPESLVSNNKLSQNAIKLKEMEDKMSDLEINLGDIKQRMDSNRNQKELLKEEILKCHQEIQEINLSSNKSITEVK